MRLMSEEVIRKLIKEKKPWDPGNAVFFWEDLPEKKRQKILKNKWLPEGVKPILAAPFAMCKKGFVLCTDNVIYSRDVDFPGDKISLAGLVGFDEGDCILTYEDGSEVQLTKMYWCPKWLQEVFHAVADAYVKPPRELTFAPEGNRMHHFDPEMGWDSVRRMPEFYLPEEMPLYLRVKLRRAFPDLPPEEVLGYCDLPDRRYACIVLTAKSILMRNYYGVTRINFEKWRGGYLTDPEDGKFGFLLGKGCELDENEDRILKVPKHLFRAVEEVVDYQYARCGTWTLFTIMRTEPITRNKAEFICYVRQRVQDYERDNSLCPEGNNPKALALNAALSKATGCYKDAAFYYELLCKATDCLTDLRLWAYAGFMRSFFQPLSLTSVRWMLYYLVQMEENCILSRFAFLDMWEAYLYDIRNTSLIDRRNELIQRFNRQAEADHRSLAFIPEGYVLDYCLKNGRK